MQIKISTYTSADGAQNMLNSGYERNFIVKSNERSSEDFHIY